MAEPLRHRYRVLLVGDDGPALAHLQAVLSERFHCHVAGTDEAITVVARDAFDVVIAHHDSAETSSFNLLASTREHSPATKVILVGSDGSARNLLEAGRRGVWDYLLSPVDDELLLSSVDRIARPEGRMPPLDGPASSLGTIVGSSPALLEALEAVDRVAYSRAPVLLVGETGTGKDLLAARIHARGPRRQRPYVVVNAGRDPGDAAR